MRRFASAADCVEPLNMEVRGRCLRGLDQRLRHETGVPVAIADDPLTSVVRGVGRMLDDGGLLRRVAAAA